MPLKSEPQETKLKENWNLKYTLKLFLYQATTSENINVINQYQGLTIQKNQA